MPSSSGQRGSGMNVVDSCGWLEYLADGPNADFFAAAVEDRDRLLVPSICVLEVFRTIMRQCGEGPALEAVAAMFQAPVVDLDAGIALRAASLGLELGLPTADSVVLATARAHDATVWTQDSHFEEIHGIRYCPA